MGRNETIALAVLAVLPIIILVVFMGVFSGAIEPFFPLLLFILICMFAVPAMAAGWRSLAIRSGLVLAPLSLLLLLSLASEDREAGYAIMILVVLLVPPLLGTLAHALSLSADRLGHSRPKSLWIEALFMILPLTWLLFGMFG